MNELSLYKTECIRLFQMLKTAKDVTPLQCYFDMETIYFSQQ